jgi:hypothetical protein
MNTTSSRAIVSAAWRIAAWISAFESCRYASSSSASDRSSLCLRKDQLDWNPRAANDRLPQHHAWVEFNAIHDCHPSLSIDSIDVLSAENVPQPGHFSASARSSRTTSRRSNVRRSPG